MEIDCFSIGIIIVIVFLIWKYVEVILDNKRYNEIGRQGGNHYPIVFLSKGKYYGSIHFWKNEIDIFGRTFLSNFGIFGDNTKQYNILYSSIKEWKIFKNDDAGEDECIRIHYLKNEKEYAIGIMPRNAGDGSLITESISNRVNAFKRQIEVERLLRAKYQAGIIEDVSPSDFEKIVKELFDFMGFSVYRIGGSGDGGVDLKGKHESTGDKVIIQCKRYKGKVGVNTIRDLYGALIHNKVDSAYIVTTGKFTSEANKWIEGKPIELIDGEKLSELMKKFYI